MRPLSLGTGAHVNVEALIGFSNSSWTSCVAGSCGEREAPQAALAGLQGNQIRVAMVVAQTVAQGALSEGSLD
jgi:hypothetical protein